MIEAALEVFKQNTHFMIITKTITDAFYGKSDDTYTDSYADAVVVPHGYSVQDYQSSIGVNSEGKIDVYTKSALKAGDLVVYQGKRYAVVDTADWATTLGSYSYYVCQIQIQ